MNFKIHNKETKMEMYMQNIFSILEKVERDIYLAKDLFKKAKNSFQLEGENFRVNNFGWEKISDKVTGVIFLQNPKEDIWEFLAHVPEEFIGEQFFTWRAAMRETGNVGKRLPTYDEVSLFLTSGHKKDIPNLSYTGYYSHSRGDFTRALSKSAHFWTSSLCSSFCWEYSAFAGYRKVDLLRSSQLNKLSVRCVKTKS